MLPLHALRMRRTGPAVRVDHPRSTGGRFLFALINQSTEKTLTPTVVHAIAKALNVQLSRDVRAAWRVEVPSVSVMTQPTPIAWPVVLLDNADQADALGYHFLTPDGQPYSRIFVETILSDGGKLVEGALSVSACVSHEILETLIDPWASFWSDTMTDAGEVALEVCDPVEDGFYDIEGIAVSNFVHPAWFDPSAQVGPYDQMGALSAPLSQTEGGYLITRTSLDNAAASAGPAMSAARKASKDATGARARRRFAPRGYSIPPAVVRAASSPDMVADTEPAPDTGK